MTITGGPPSDDDTPFDLSADECDQPTEPLPTLPPVIPYAVLVAAGIEFWQAFELVEHRERWAAFPRELLAFDGDERSLRRLAFLAWCVEQGRITDGLETRRAEDVA